MSGNFSISNISAAQSAAQAVVPSIGGNPQQRGQVTNSRSLASVNTSSTTPVTAVQVRSRLAGLQPQTGKQVTKAGSAQEVTLSVGRLRRGALPCIQMGSEGARFVAANSPNGAALYIEGQNVGDNLFDNTLYLQQTNTDGTFGPKIDLGLIPGTSSSSTISSPVILGQGNHNVVLYRPSSTATVVNFVQVDHSQQTPTKQFQLDATAFRAAYDGVTLNAAIVTFNNGTVSLQVNAPAFAFGQAGDKANLSLPIALLTGVSRIPANLEVVISGNSVIVSYGSPSLTIQRYEISRTGLSPIPVQTTLDLGSSTASYKIIMSGSDVFIQTAKDHPTDPTQSEITIGKYTSGLQQVGALTTETIAGRTPLVSTFTRDGEQFAIVRTTTTAVSEATVNFIVAQNTNIVTRGNFTADVIAPSSSAVVLQEGSIFTVSDIGGFEFIALSEDGAKVIGQPRLLSSEIRRANANGDNDALYFKVLVENRNGTSSTVMYSCPITDILQRVSTSTSTTESTTKSTTESTASSTGEPSSSSSSSSTSASSPASTSASSSPSSSASSSSSSSAPTSSSSSAPTSAPTSATGTVNPNSDSSSSNDAKAEIIAPVIVGGLVVGVITLVVAVRCSRSKAQQQVLPAADYNPQELDDVVVDPSNNPRQPRRLALFSDPQVVSGRPEGHAGTPDQAPAGAIQLTTFGQQPGTYYPAANSMGRAEGLRLLPLLEEEDVFAADRQILRRAPSLDDSSLVPTQRLEISPHREVVGDAAEVVHNIGVPDKDSFEVAKIRDLQQYQQTLIRSVSVITTEAFASDATDGKEIKRIARYIDAAFNALVAYRRYANQDLDVANQNFEHCAFQHLNVIPDLTTTSRVLTPALDALKKAWSSLVGKKQDAAEKLNAFVDAVTLLDTYSHTSKVWNYPIVAQEIAGVSQELSLGQDARAANTTANQSEYETSLTDATKRLLRTVPPSDNLEHISMGLNHILNLIPDTQTPNRNIQTIQRQVDTILTTPFFHQVESALASKLSFDSSVYSCRDLSASPATKQAWLHIQAAVLKIKSLSTIDPQRIWIPAAVSAVGYLPGTNAMQCVQMTKTTLTEEAYQRLAKEIKVLLQNAVEAVQQEKLLADVSQFIKGHERESYLDPNIESRLKLTKDAFGNPMTTKVRYRGNFPSRQLGYQTYNGVKFGKTTELNSPDKPISIGLERLTVMEGPYGVGNSNNLVAFRTEMLEGKKQFLAIGPEFEEKREKFTNYIGFSRSDSGVISYQPQNISAEHTRQLNEAGIEITAIEVDASNSTDNVKFLKVTMNLFDPAQGDPAVKQQKQISVIHLPNINDCTPIDFNSPASSTYVKMAVDLYKELIRTGASEQDAMDLCIHCSAGIGRSGIFALAFVLLKNSLDTDKARNQGTQMSEELYLSDLNGVLAGLKTARNFRMGLIQVYSQLESAVHLAILMRNQLRQEQFEGTSEV